MEPLNALRHSVSEKLSDVVVSSDENVLRVGGRAFALDQPTAAVRSAGREKGRPYTVREVHAALLHADAPLGEYVAYSEKNDIRRLLAGDQKRLVQFLRGAIEAEACDVLDKQLVSTATSLSHTVSGGGGSGSGSAAAAAAVESSGAAVSGAAAPAPAPAASAERERLADGEATAGASADTDALLDAAVAKERLQRTRNTVLEARRVGFQSVLGTLERVLKRDKEAKRMRVSSGGGGGAAAAAVDADDIARGDRYKADTRRAYREAGMDEVERLQIDPSAGFSAAAAGSAGNGVAAENEPRARGASTNANDDDGNGGGGEGHRRQQRHHGGASDGPPIIIVPAGLQPLVTLLNAAQLLERGEFHSPAELRAQGAKKPSGRVTVTRNGRRYVVTDQPHRLRGRARSASSQQPSTTAGGAEDEWSRVVAVVCQGAPWQFKGWPFDSPTQIFVAARGFCFHYEDEKVPPAVKQWSVKCMPLSRSRRHMDQSVVLEFWSAVEAHLQQKQLRQQQQLLLHQQRQRQSSGR